MRTRKLAWVAAVLLLVITGCSSGEGTDGGGSTPRATGDVVEEDPAGGPPGDGGPTSVFGALFQNIVSGAESQVGSMAAGWLLSAIGVGNGEADQLAEIQSELQSISA